jgi:uncharacterized protein (TIGR03435 family)
MKRRDKHVEDFVLRHLGLFKTPPQHDMDLAEARIESKLRTASPAIVDETERLPRHRISLNRIAVGFAAAAALVFVLFLVVPRGTDAAAAVLDGSFSRTLGTRTEIVHVGDAVEAGAIIRTNEGSGAIQLADSRVETKKESEFLWERAEDGIRIRLNKGSVIVNAETGAGRIYVQTKNAVVFGANSIFLVVAEEEGSRVAVIHGEVRVQQGAEAKKLTAAEQLATNPVMEMLPLEEAIAWSRNAAAHLAMLPPQAPTPVPPKKDRTTFEVISIRPSAPLPGAGLRGGPAGDGAKAAPFPDLELARSRTITCGGPGAELDVSPGRFLLRGATVYRLMVLAYGLKDCSLALQTNAITKGPDWIQTERYDVEAVIPEGSPESRQELNRGEAPKLQLMIQNLLADRFQLMVHRERKDVVAFNLVVAKPGKIQLSEDQTPPEPQPKGPGFITRTLPRGVLLNCTGNAVPISAFAACLQRSAGGVIIDKTDLKGLYDIPAVPNWDFSAPAAQSAYASEVLEQIGLKLEPAKTAGEVLVIDRVAKPTEN